MWLFLTRRLAEADFLLLLLAQHSVVQVVAFTFAVASLKNRKPNVCCFQPLHGQACRLPRGWWEDQEQLSFQRGQGGEVADGADLRLAVAVQAPSALGSLTGQRKDSL